MLANDRRYISDTGFGEQLYDRTNYPRAALGVIYKLKENK